ncbi:LysR family transcriptional regulator [Rhizobium nepotum]|uniref:HTH lysR-type domain-containing protein n=1 Tax=Rhizobium nepotum 39/7 TaxID=1368418 RepID=A0ABR5CKQ4_9HYPH|nr:LysR family transcriptional regulator [Rhizobium nepotum]KJF65442.1 hypothetical protein RS75_23055 [Rhizobium nepotum 39/7]
MWSEQGHNAAGYFQFRELEGFIGGFPRFGRENARKRWIGLVNNRFQSYPTLLDLESLASFCAIAEHGTFAAAADAMDCSPSTLTHRIKKLEGALGVTLVYRTRPAATISREGKILLEYAHSMLSLSDEIILRVQIQVPPVAIATVTLGATTDLTEGSLIKILNTIQQRRPDILVNVEEGLAADLINRHDQGQLNLVMFTSPGGENGHRGEVVGSDPYVWTEAVNGEARKFKPLRVALGAENSVIGACVSKSLSEQNVHHRIVLSSDSSTLRRACVIADAAVSPLPRSSLTAATAIVAGGRNLPALPVAKICLLQEKAGHEAAKAVGAALKVGFR